MGPHRDYLRCQLTIEVRCRCASMPLFSQVPGKIGLTVPLGKQIRKVFPTTKGS